MSNDHFRELYEAHFNLVRRSLRRWGVRDADIPDQVQKVFLTVLLKLRGFEGRSQFQTWLHGICRRVAADYRRAAVFRREVTRDGRLFDDHEATLRHPPHEAVQHIRSLLSKLPPKQRSVFLLYELEDVPVREIALSLGITRGTASSRLRLARQALAQAVRRERHDARFS